ncbi:hypothetical protein VHEMI05320 [[Torrubiella] hemipterigena]|uniref:Uncharacterized protein n=1 Tax=[Torrubiella] hemipterigena TaxID=1531966 RepID=A0A0A1T3R9_9HYPO|nr:hypothetical protein VHEMI05320 [[Torrubiella] hemipterigena]
MLIPQSALCFVHSSHPADVATHKKRIRSHAAKNAVMRQQRVVNYQIAKAMRSSVVGADGAKPGLVLAAAINSPVLKFERFLLHHFVVHVIGQAVTCIPFDAISHGDKHAAKWHLRAASIMVNSRGGIQGIASNGSLGKLLVWILKDPIHQNGALVGPNCLASVFTRQNMKLNQAQNNPVT